MNTLFRCLFIALMLGAGLAQAAEPAHEHCSMHQAAAPDAVQKRLKAVEQRLDALERAAKRSAKSETQSASPTAAK